MSRSDTHRSYVIEKIRKTWREKLQTFILAQKKGNGIKNNILIYQELYRCMSVDEANLHQNLTNLIFPLFVANCKC